MLSLALSESVRARLEGRGPDYVPPLPRINDFESGQQGRVAPIKKSTFEANIRQPGQAAARVQVSIHPFGIDGNLTDRAYPSITFNLGPAKPRYTEAVPVSSTVTSEHYVEEVGPRREIVFDDGDTLLVPALLRRRTMERPYDVSVEIRAYAKDVGFRSFLQNYVYRAFPPRSFIRVRMADGTIRTWDMLHTDTQDLDSREAALTGYADREFALAITYNVEAYSDETAEWSYELPAQSLLIL
jgi:hypothetical protein